MSEIISTGEEKEEIQQSSQLVAHPKTAGNLMKCLTQMFLFQMCVVQCKGTNAETLK
jgi:hypothetical protein